MNNSIIDEQNEEDVGSLATSIQGAQNKLGAFLKDRNSILKLWNSISLILGRFSSSGLGFLTWLITARLYPTEEVGIASGVISAMMLCVQLSLVGLNSAIIAMYPKYKENPSRLMNTAINLVTVTSMLAAVTFLLLASVVFEELDVVGESMPYTLLFLGLTYFGTLNTLMDHTSIALRRGDQVLFRNVLFGLITIGVVAAFPFVLNQTQSIAVVSGWTLAGLAACTLGAVQLFQSMQRFEYRLEVDWRIARQLVQVGIRNYLLTLAERAPNWVMPIIVTELLSPTENAYWYTLWMMAWVVYIIPISVSQNLFADISHDPDNVDEAIRYSNRTSLILGSSGAILALLLANFMLSLLGAEYAAAGTVPLRILVVGVFPVMFIQAYYAVCRGKNTLDEAIITGFVSGIAGVGIAAAAGVEFGLIGMAATWLGVQTLTALWAAVRLRMLSRQTAVQSGAS